MINLFKKFSPCKGIALVIVLMTFVNGGAYASTLNGVIRGDTLSWTNGMTVEDDVITLSNWQIISGLQPTTAWAPGTFIGETPSSLTLIGEGQTFDIDIKVVGLQYNLGQAASHFLANASESAPGFSRCQSSELGSSIATVIGESCLAEGVYTSGDMYSPFQFARPLIKIDEGALMAAFEDSGVGSGQYSGTMMVSPFYNFRAPSGTWTYRKAMSLPVTLSLRYEPAFLTSIVVSGNGIMPAVYDKTNQTVSGEAVFNITATGFFTDGLKLTFEDDDFHLMGEETDTQIPYSITCTLCENLDIVIDGDMQLVGEETVASVNGEIIDFAIKVHYDAKGADVESDTYNDSFTVMFEENL
ncbi:MAG: hypothetical protein V5788_02980 [Shewanella sp.]